MPSPQFYYTYKPRQLSYGERKTSPQYAIGTHPSPSHVSKPYASFLLQITFLLIVVIILGALTKLIKSDPLWITYHVGQGLQGIFIAMLVTCNCQVLKLYTRSFKSRAGIGPGCPSSYGNIVPGARSLLGKGGAISKSTSLQLLTWEPTPDPV